MMLATTDSDILGRLLELDGEHLSPENAKLVLALKFPEADVKRVEVLGDKANEGTLTLEEREQYDAYVRVGMILDVLKARAVLALRTLGKTA